MPLTLRLTVIAGETAPDDYTVIEDGHPVGRIRRAVERTDVEWHWRVTVTLPGGPFGTSAGFEPAKAAFRQAWTAFKATIPPEEMDRALDDARAANERHLKRPPRA